MNNRKMIAVAVAAAFGLPLAAQAQSSVTVYGKLFPQINSYSVHGATAAGPGNSLSRPTGAPDRKGLAMESNNSRLGFRGTEDLGGNLKALFQLEMKLGVDDGSSRPGELWSRAALVGLSGGFGTVKLGKMDTVYKNMGDRLDMLGIGSGNFAGVVNTLGYHGFGSNAASNFHLRRNNSIVYESPEFGGFQGLFDYSLGEVEGNTSRGSLISAGVKYELGPIYLALAHEIHNDLFGGSRNMPTTGLQSVTGKESKDTGTRLTAQYKFTSNTTAEVNFARLEWKESGGSTGHFQSFKRNAWSLGAQHKINAVTLQASYSGAGTGSCSLMGGVVCNSEGLEGKVFNVGTSYTLSKRTMLYAIASKMINGQYATFSNTDAPGVAAPGADIRQVAVGILHSF